MAIIDFITKETFNFSLKWIINQGLAIVVMCVIIYFDRQEKKEMKASISELNTELKTYLKTDRDTLLYVLKDVNETLKPYKKNGR
jgi:hypothetical protein